MIDLLICIDLKPLVMYSILWVSLFSLKMINYSITTDFFKTISGIISANINLLELWPKKHYLDILASKHSAPGSISTCHSTQEITSLFASKFKIWVLWWTTSNITPKIMIKDRSFSCHSVMSFLLIQSWVYWIS